MSSNESSDESVESVGSGGGVVVMTEAMRAASLVHLLSEEFLQTAGMYETYPDGYDRGVADTNNRLYENAASDMLLEGEDGRMQATLQGARILVATGMALAMSRAYHCARAELRLERGSPLDVRDAFESIRRMVVTWSPVIRGLDAGLVPMEIMANIEVDGDEEEDLNHVRAVVRGSGVYDWKAPCACPRCTN